jgi:hypothetical protein
MKTKTAPSGAVFVLNKVLFPLVPTHNSMRLANFRNTIVGRGARRT